MFWYCPFKLRKRKSEQLNSVNAVILNVIYTHKISDLVATVTVCISFISLTNTSLLIIWKRNHHCTKILLSTLIRKNTMRNSIFQWDLMSTKTKRIDQISDITEFSPRKKIDRALQFRTASHIISRSMIHTNFLI